MWKLILVGAASLLAGCGSAKLVTTTQTVQQTTTQTNTQTNTVTHIRRLSSIPPVTTTRTETTTVTTLPSPSGTFSGNGSENVGTVHVAQPSELRWSCPSCGGDNFTIGNNPSDGNQIDVNALGPTSGQTYLDSGTYHDVEVDTEGGAWTVTILPKG